MPISFSVVNSTATTVNVSWQAPADSNGIRLGYYLNVTDPKYLLVDSGKETLPIPPNEQENEDSFSNLLPDDSQFLVTMLHPFASYRLTLQARTVKGLGDVAKLDVQTLPSCEYLVLVTSQLYL